MRGVLAALAVGLSTPALAGSGPWVLGARDGSFYGGVEVQRLTRLGITAADGSRDVIDVDQGLSTVGAKAVVSYGLLPRVELEGTVPWYRIQANRTDGDVCTTLGLGACRTTETLGVVELRVKGLLLDELAGSPVSISTVGQLRMGAFTAPTRQRITNAGEGTQDLGAALSVGRTGGLANGFWSAYAEVGWRYRLRNTTDYPGTPFAPGQEVTIQSETFLAPDSRVAFGPEVSATIRPQGLPFGELDLSDPDRFAALRYTSVRVGAKLLVRDNRGTSLVLGVMRTVFARNNPVDVTIVTAGVGVDGFLRRSREDE